MNTASSHSLQDRHFKKDRRKNKKTTEGPLVIPVRSEFAFDRSKLQQKSPTSDAGAAIQLPPLDHPSQGKESPIPGQLEPDKRIGFAIVGLGKLSLSEILPAFGNCKYAKPVALVSGDSAKAKIVAAQYGIDANSIYGYDNFDEIKNNAAVQVIYIVLPNGMHEAFVVRSAKAGKHILCEKPMSNTSAEAERMIAACEKAAVKLMIAYRIQYEPINRLAKEWVRTEKYGQAKVIEMYNGQNTGDATQWRLNKALAGGGSLPDIGLYCLNTARFLTGEEPLWVNATVHSTPGDDRFKEVEETVLWQMQFPNGTLVNAATCYSAHEGRRYKVYADNGGTFGLDPAFSYKGLKMECTEIHDDQAFKSTALIEEKNQFATEMDHMAKCVLDNKKPYTPGEEGLQDMRIMEAIYQSGKEQHRIQLTPIEGTDVFRGEWFEV